MLRILFTPDDLASTRFLPEPAPMLELKFVAVGLRRGIRATWVQRWRSRALAAIPMSARPTVRQVGGHFSWALSPSFAVSAELDEGMETSLGFGTEMALYFSAPNSGVPWLPRHYEVRATEHQTLGTGEGLTRLRSDPGRRRGSDHGHTRARKASPWMDDAAPAGRQHIEP